MADSNRTALMTLKELHLFFKRFSVKQTEEIARGLGIHIQKPNNVRKMTYVPSHAYQFGNGYQILAMTATIGMFAAGRLMIDSYNTATDEGKVICFSFFLHRQNFYQQHIYISCFVVTKNT